MEPQDADDPEAAGRVHEVLEVPIELAGLRLDQALAELLPMHSRARLQRWLKRGQLVVDGHAARPRQRVLGGERVLLDAELEASEHLLPQPVDFEVLHADADLVIVAKPVGLVVHPGAGNPDGTLVNGLLHRFPELAGLPRAGIVHRLDKDTSGLLAVARSLAAHTALVQQLAAREMGREYLAVVEQVPVAGGRIDAPIGRDPRNRLRMAVVHDGRDATTHFRVLERYRAHALLRCVLETGRTHQIRVHLSQEGFPIVGDRLYGARGRLPPAPSEALVAAVRAFRRQALHARRLTLAHPVTRETLTFEAPVPDDMQRLLELLAADAAEAVET
ncbi:MAG: 23S rRNA pseudouridine(1911/1915/1917) synthase RluD [Pseudomonadales bacterium]|jgi:23S rRNA pseudouridine1911/1915/1917 synthase|nr:23S rRNA pseudouridine(1911/1915/1917) synthase RluD [Pseudomonadales bacterium]